ncbi:MAG: hypothetical protein RJA77_774 [Pseudomonadota bacterium]|jgi:tetratricopeptide (TPR) repeat protein
MSDTIGAAFMKQPFSRLLLSCAAGVLTASACSGAWASAASVSPVQASEVLRLIEDGQSAQAIEQLSQALAQSPSNLEVANQLAVVLTGVGQVDRARQVLENALLAHPEASKGFQSLRSIAASQFAESYAKAMGKPAPASSKLTLATEDLSTDRVKKALQVAKAKEDERIRQAALDAKLKAIEAARETARAPEVVAAVKPSPAAKPASTKAVVEQRLEAWAKSWSSMNFDAYADFYAETFKTNAHPSRSAWLAFRKPRILNKPRILVEVSQVNVQFQGNEKATVRFLQRYEAGNLKLSSRKSQTWVLEGQAWRIQSESN